MIRSQRGGVPGEVYRVSSLTVVETTARRQQDGEGERAGGGCSAVRVRGRSVYPVCSDPAAGSNPAPSRLALALMNQSS